VDRHAVCAVPDLDQGIAEACRRYQRQGYSEERIEALEIWSQVLTGKTAKPGKVVPLQAKRGVA
jgi:hypothetical protein